MIAESYERIHRSNLIGMGIAPLQYLPGENTESLGLTGKESFTIEYPKDLGAGSMVTVTVSKFNSCFFLLNFSKAYYTIIKSVDSCIFRT